MFILRFTHTPNLKECDSSHSLLKRLKFYEKFKKYKGLKQWVLKEKTTEW